MKAIIIQIGKKLLTATMQFLALQKLPNFLPVTVSFNHYTTRHTLYL